MARLSCGITQFYLPPTHEPYLPLFPPQSITALWLVLANGGVVQVRINPFTADPVKALHFAILV